MDKWSWRHYQCLEIFMGAMKKAALGAPCSALLFQSASRYKTHTANPSHHLCEEINVHVKKRRLKPIQSQQTKGQTQGAPSQKGQGLLRAGRWTGLSAHGSCPWSPSHTAPVAAELNAGMNWNKHIKPLWEETCQHLDGSRD